MKKFLKLSVLVFLITGIASAVGVKAYTGYVGFAGVAVPNYYGMYEGPSALKKTNSYQRARKNHAYDNLSHDERAVEAQVCLGSTCSPMVDLPQGQIKTWGNTMTMSEILYVIRIRNSNKNILTGSSFYGDWYLDY